MAFSRGPGPDALFETLSLLLEGSEQRQKGAPGACVCMQTAEPNYLFMSSFKTVLPSYLGERKGLSPPGSLCRESSQATLELPQREVSISSRFLGALPRRELHWEQRWRVHRCRSWARSSPVDTAPLSKGLGRGTGEKRNSGV